MKKNCIINPGGICQNCAERTESDGYGEFIHTATGKYVCHPEQLKRGMPVGSVDIATPKTEKR